MIACPTIHDVAKIYIKFNSSWCIQLMSIAGYERTYVCTNLCKVQSMDDNCGEWRVGGMYGCG